MQSHEAHRWVQQAKQEDWPQNLQTSYVNGSDGLFHGNYSVKNKDTGTQYTTNEEMRELDGRNNRYRMS